MYTLIHHKKMQKFDKIRPFYDAEINEAIRSSVNHPMMKALMNFTFPEVDDSVWKDQLIKTHSIRDFQCNFIYQSVQKVLEKSSDGLSMGRRNVYRPHDKRNSDGRFNSLGWRVGG